MGMYRINKTSLSGFDDKRGILNNRIKTLICGRRDAK